MSYTYSEDKDTSPTISDVTFRMNQGETLALVGCSGAGKSTTLSLLYRAMDPDTGYIAIDGHNIHDLSLETLRSNISVVFQETLLLNRSIAENLRVGKPTASDEELMEACRRAQALSFIERFPFGFASEVCERGRGLSGVSGSDYRGASPAERCPGTDVG